MTVSAIEWPQSEIGFARGHRQRLPLVPGRLARQHQPGEPARAATGSARICSIHHVDPVNTRRPSTTES